MKKKSTTKLVRVKSTELPSAKKIDWARVDRMSAKQRDKNARSDPDSFLADDDFWKMAKLVMPEQEAKERITIRIDSKVLRWFKSHGEGGYQSRINSILRAFVETAGNKKHNPIQGHR